MLRANKVLPGHFGELFDDSSNFLASIPTFQSRVSVTNTDYQAAGSSIRQAVPVGYSVTLTFTETVVNDTQLLKRVLDAIKNGTYPGLSFQGKIKNRSGDYERVIYRDCVPDGDFDVQNIQPGEIITRAWSWRCNNPPDLQSYFD